MGKIYRIYTKTWLKQLKADVRQVFGENEDAVWMQNPNKKPILHQQKNKGFGRKRNNLHRCCVSLSLIKSA